MKLVENLRMKGVVPTKSAALYYKTESLRIDVSQYTHVNNWMVVEIIRLLTSQGYLVDLIDRTCHDWAPKKTYDLFLGLGVGSSGKNFANYADISGAPKKVLLAMGPQPDISNKLVLERYEMFHKRTGQYAPPMRTVDAVTGENFIRIIKSTDFIFNAGEQNSPAYNSFVKYGKPVINIYPPSSPSVVFDSDWLHSRDINSFLCFSGNGFICKGVDLVVESFLKNPEKRLHICGPSSEAAFFNYYGELIKNSSNIKYHGFIIPGGKKFNELAAECSFVVFHSAAESCATSVTTCMRAGLVPIINKWTSIIVEKGCVEISEDGDLIQNITNMINMAATMDREDYQQKVNSILEKSKVFSEKSFTESFTKAISYVVQDEINTNTGEN
jgi:hypothetical protein